VGEAALRVRCPAKINLLLRVLRRREDGYHELDTVFQAIDLWDELAWRAAAGLQLTCDEPAVPTDDSNLVMRAARLLARREGIEPHGAFVLRKTIPAQAGLGGGSSDAAGALLLCRRAWGLDTPDDVLSGLGAELGADVPFFLVGGTARGTARGDRISPLEPLAEATLILGFPPYGIPTSEVFGRVKDRLTLPQNTVSLPARFAHKWPEEKDFPLAVNDLERVVFEGWPELARFRNALIETGATRAMLSGSGSTVFGVFPAADRCERVSMRLREAFTGWTLVTTRTVPGGVRFMPPP